MRKTEWKMGGELRKLEEEGRERERGEIDRGGGRERRQREQERKTEK